MKRLILVVASVAALAVLVVTAGAGVSTTNADPHLGQSVDVVIIGGTTLDPTCGAFNLTDANEMIFSAGGCLPVTGPAGELGDFSFTAMDPTAVSAVSLAPYDTAVLNVAAFAMACNTNTLAPAQQADLVAFVGAGHKLVIYDSECTPQDYSWLPYPFTTSNPGALGAPGTLTIVEDNLLSTLIGDPSCVGGDPHCIDVANLGPNTDAVGDMNVMTTFDPNWCIDMSGTNASGVIGPVHTYADFPSGTDAGLFIYNGLDQDEQILGFDDPDLRKIWVQELQQPFNPAGLPCLVSAVGITLNPDSETNEVGTGHTVTAGLTDLLGVPQPDVLVEFEVTAGPNAGEISDPGTGECTVNDSCTTDASGQVSWTYTGSGGIGSDRIRACFVAQDGTERCAEATKEWIEPPFIEVPVDIKPTSCRNPLKVGGGGVLPAAILGTADLDVTEIDVSTLLLEGVSPLRWFLRDVATPFEPFIGKVDAFDCTDEGPDGFLDLTLKFDKRDIVAALGPVADGDVIVLHLTGNLLDGTPIVGEDVVVILDR